MKLTIFGATGGTGMEVVKQALAAGHQVTAFARTPGKIELDHSNLKIVQGSIEQADRVEAAVAGSEAVISALGPTRNSPPGMLTSGMRHVLQAMNEHDVQRLIVATGAGVADPNDEPKLINKFITFLLKTTAGSVLEDSVGMVNAVRNSDRDWVIVRAPRLADAPQRKQLKAGYVGKGPGASLTRADFAAFMLDQLADNTWLHKAPAISN